MNREIKFRIWDPHFMVMQYDIEELDLSDPYDNDDLMQYTGVKDKNGVEIYEGDLVAVNATGFNFKFPQKLVEFREGMFGIRWKEYTTTSNLLKLTAFEVAVIGNIYENPEWGQS